MSNAVAIVFSCHHLCAIQQVVSEEAQRAKDLAAVEGQEQLDRAVTEVVRMAGELRDVRHAAQQYLEQVGCLCIFPVPGLVFWQTPALLQGRVVATH